MKYLVFHLNVQKLFRNVDEITEHNQILMGISQYFVILLQDMWSCTL